jgi:dihydrofolate synthase/folylpolyglutamate synthase
LTTAYESALAKLLSSTTRPKLGLERMAELLRRLGDPQRRWPALHIAGTKGKGSTAAFAERICREAGLKTGLTTSPHLQTARERIAIDGAMIAERDFVRLAARVEEAAADLDASFFEKMIAMAFLHFADERVDVAVVEVGLGGRLDATNLCVPRACAITRLGLDHTEHLGPTIVHIAREKAGIIKPGGPVVTVAQEPDAARVIEEVARDRGAPLTVVDVDASLCPSLAGAHQRENASVAAALVRASGIVVDEGAVHRGVAAARWPGRYETLRDDPALVVDGAHNATAAEALVETVRADRRMERPILVVGFTRGHDPRAFAEVIAAVRPRMVAAVTSRSPRSQTAAEVARACAPVFGVVHEAGLEEALQLSRGGPTLVTGSLYLVGEVRQRLLGGPSDAAFPLF